jgi:transmembrane sensor
MMIGMRHKTAKAIDVEAAAWAAKLDRGVLTPGERQALDAWADSDVRCAGALGRAQGILLVSQHAQALGRGFDPAKFTPPSQHSLSRRSVLIGGSIAATLACAAVSWRMLAQGANFQTSKGEVRVFALADGSVVTLNTASEVRVNYTAMGRDIKLVRGEVLFDVAKDAARPFIVAAGDTLVRVVGTSFTVKKLQETPVQVLVREGVVEVSKPEKHFKAIELTANIRAISPLDTSFISKEHVRAADLHRELAWRDGQIAFRGQTLEQAATEFARYSDIRIVIADPAIRQEEIAGMFRANDPVGFAQNVAVSLNAKVTIGDNEVRLSR